MSINHWLAVLLPIACLVLVSGCTDVGGDDDSALADDDDDGTNPSAPVLSDYKIQYAHDGNDNCKAWYRWHVEDAEGDIDGSTIQITMNGVTSTITLSYSQPPPIYSDDVSIDVIVGDSTAYVPMEFDTVYDSELLMRDFDGNESNHLTIEGWQAPGSDCT